MWCGGRGSAVVQPQKWVLVWAGPGAVLWAWARRQNNTNTSKASQAVLSEALGPEGWPWWWYPRTLLEDEASDALP